MIFADYSPHDIPSLDRQKDALRKGLGRTMRWALGGHLVESLLLSACIENQVFDAQCEDPRGEWLWRLIQTIGAAERFRQPILNALKRLTDERDAIQLCELAKLYAKAGDTDARKRLYEIVEQKPFSTMPWLGENELLEIDVGQALVFAARARGDGLATREWEWDDRSFIENAVERLGEHQVQELLENNSNEGISRFWKTWCLESKKQLEQAPLPSHEQRMRAISLGEIISSAESDRPAFGYLRGWGMFADSDDLTAVLHRLWAAENPKVIANFLTVFSNRAMPAFDSRLIALCSHSDEKVQMRAFQALSKNRNPEVRSFALAELENGLTDGAIASLFICNYEPGDETRILDALALPSDENELHCLLMDIAKVLKTNPDADASKLGIIIYGHTPCENCRFTALEQLQRQQAAPTWMMAECRFDSNEECRTLAEQKAAEAKNR